MQTNFQMLKTFKYNPEHRGVCTSTEVEQIENHFQLNERSNVELQNFRDFVVMYYSFITNELRKKDFDEYMKQQDTMSAITGVVDHHKYKRGMEV